MKSRTNLRVADPNVASCNLRNACLKAMQAKEKRSIALSALAKDPDNYKKQRAYHSANTLLDAAEQAELEAEQEWELATNTTEF